MLKYFTDLDLSMRWLSPEVLDTNQITENRVFSEKTEIWSFGVLLYELITKGETPYKCMRLYGLKRS